MELYDKNVEHFKLEKGKYVVEALLHRLGEDYLFTIWGGKAHIGAVAMAQPRKSLRDPNKTSATASVFCYIGHKEDELVKHISELMSAQLNAKVVVLAGLHWDNLKPKDIEEVNRIVYDIVDIVLYREKTMPN